MRKGSCWRGQMTRRIMALFVFCSRRCRVWAWRAVRQGLVARVMIKAAMDSNRIAPASKTMFTGAISLPCNTISRATAVMAMNMG